MSKKAVKAVKLFPILLALLFVLLLNIKTNAQEIYPLYPDKIPNSKPTGVKEVKLEKNGDIIYQKVSIPTISPFIPQDKKENRAAIIVVPGGGYVSVAYTNTGTKIAEYFQKEGIVAFVLKYRLPSDNWMKDKKIGPIQDLQSAILWVKQHAKEYRVDTAKIGLCGGSAGGHLVAMGSTQFKTNFINNPQHISLRPAFSILLYPVISFADSLTHMGSRNNLLGKQPSEELIKRYSNELNVNPQTPPTFLVHAQDDHTSPVMNSILYYEALTKNGVPSELHIYPHGGHGFGTNNKTTPDNWLERCKNWMISNKWISKQ